VFLGLRMAHVFQPPLPFPDSNLAHPQRTGMHSAANSFFSHYAQTDALNRTRCSSAGGARVGDNTSVGRPGTDVVYNVLTCPSDACGRLLY